MKQIDNKTLCKYCLGCNLQEMEYYKPVMRCRYFIPGMSNWNEKLREELKNDK